MKNLLTSEEEARFWSKVRKTPDCWLWTAQLRNGYGIFRFRGKIVSAHRLSLSQFEEIEGFQVRHSCDTPACVRPEHLLLGSAINNSNDKMTRSRHKFKLTNQQVLDIRSRPVTITMCRELADEFDVSPSHIKKILTGEMYAWLPGAKEIPQQFTAHKLSHQDFHEILQALSSQKWGTQTQLANKYGVTRGTISHINRQRIKYSITDTK